MANRNNAEFGVAREARSLDQLEALRRPGRPINCNNHAHAQPPVSVVDRGCPTGSAQCRIDSWAPGHTDPNPRRAVRHWCGRVGAITIHLGRGTVGPEGAEMEDSERSFARNVPAWQRASPTRIRPAQCCRTGSIARLRGAAGPRTGRPWPGRGRRRGVPDPGRPIPCPICRTPSTSRSRQRPKSRSRL